MIWPSIDNFHSILLRLELEDNPFAGMKMDLHLHLPLSNFFPESFDSRKSATHVTNEGIPLLFFKIKAIFGFETDFAFNILVFHILELEAQRGKTITL